MFCKNCGAELRDGYAFCASCGTPVENEVKEPAAEPEVAEQPVTPEVAEQPAEPAVAEQPAAEETAEQPAVQGVPAEQPIMPVYQQPVQEVAPGKGFAVASLVLGIVSFFCFAIITGPLAIIFGAVARSKGQKGMATAGLICGIIGIVLYIITLLAAPSLYSSLFNFYG